MPTPRRRSGPLYCNNADWQPPADWRDKLDSCSAEDQQAACATLCSFIDSLPEWARLFIYEHGITPVLTAIKINGGLPDSLDYLLSVDAQLKAHDESLIRLDRNLKENL